MRIHLLLPLIFLSGLAAAHPCSTTAVGETCAVKIADLHPTQFNLGQLEVGERADKFEKWSAKKLQKYIEENPVPLVLGPNGGLYITDHHHLARALEIAGVQEMQASVQADDSRLGISDFWQKMIADGMVFLEDKGVGGQSPEKLPATIAAMTDDPYRSLAWSVRKAGGYDASTVRYADFMWSDFFRSRMAITGDYAKSVSEGVTLAHSPAAKSLPGYTP